MQKEIETIEQLNSLLAESVIGEGPDRMEGSVTQFSHDDDKKVFRGFLMDYTSDCRLRFLYLLVKHGFKQVTFEAPYWWKYENGRFTVEYVEGDVYVKDKAQGELVGSEMNRAKSVWLGDPR